MTSLLRTLLFLARATAVAGALSLSLVACGDDGSADDDDDVAGDDDDDVQGDDDDDLADGGPAGDDDDDLDGGPMIDDPFDGAPGIQIGIGCDRQNETFVPLTNGETVRFEPGLQGPTSRHVEVGARAWNFDLEPPPGRPEAPMEEWVTARQMTAFRIIDSEGTVAGETSPLVRFFPTEAEQVPYRTLVTRVMVGEDMFEAVLGAPVTLEVERAEGDATFTDRAENIILMETEPCVEPDEG